VQELVTVWSGSVRGMRCAAQQTSLRPHRIHLVQFGMQPRTLGPCSAATHRKTALAWCDVAWGGEGDISDMFARLVNVGGGPSDGVVALADAQRARDE
jgi:hypothetical protein